MDYKPLIHRWKISYVILAAKMGMPRGTFNNKINDKQPAYKFTPEEEKKLVDILHDMAWDVFKTLPTGKYNYSIEVSPGVAAALKNSVIIKPNIET